MTEVEAVEFVVRLVAQYPGVKFTQDNARAYQSLVVALGAEEAEKARVELAETNKFIPSFAEIREVVMRNRRQAGRALVVTTLRLPDSHQAPAPSEWKPTLERQLEASARHQAMAEKWYAERGKRPPPDPARAFIDLAASGARGDDVRTRFRRTVLNNPTYSVEEQEELDRRHP